MSHNKYPGLGSFRESRAAQVVAGGVALSALVGSLVACGSGKGNQTTTGKVGPVATASGVPGTPAPESPTDAPASTGLQFTKEACAKLSADVYNLFGDDLGYTDATDAQNNCEPYPPSYNLNPGFPGERGPALHWEGLLGGTNAVILQEIQSDQGGKVFNQAMNASITVNGNKIPLTDRHFTVDGLPGGSQDLPASFSGILRNSTIGADYALTIFEQPQDPDAKLLPTEGVQLFQELLADA